MDDVSAYDVAKANLRLATDFSKIFAQRGEKVAILLPDEAERNIAVENFGSNNPYPGIIIESLRRSDPNDARVFKPEQIFLNLLGSKSGAVTPIEGIDMYIIIVASAQELPDVEEVSKRGAKRRDEMSERVHSGSNPLLRFALVPSTAPPRRH